MRHVLVATTTALLMGAFAVHADAQAKPAATAELPSVALPRELDRLLRDYEGAWGRGDANALASLFAEDGFVLQGGKPPVRGRAFTLTLRRQPGGRWLIFSDMDNGSQPPRPPATPPS